VLPAKELPGTGRPVSRKGTMQLLAYDLAADGSARFRRVLVDYAPEDGPDSNLLYITADKSLYRIRLNRQGHHP
jgi:hypothetical protein